MSSVVDPEFPRRGGANSKGGGAKLLFWPISRQNFFGMVIFSVCSPRGRGVARGPVTGPVWQDLATSIPRILYLGLALMIFGRELAK